MKELLLALMLGSGACVSAVETGPNMANETALAYDKTYDFFAGNNAIKRIGAVVSYTSATL